MKVSSTAGDLDVFIKDKARIVGDTVLLNAEMGVWQFQIYLNPGDFRFFFSLIFSRAVLTFLIKQPFLYIFRQIKK
ncbi:MAG: hypothetical protein KAJ31_07305 [Deltaproteobacteria bacterium]|nr:hypothetical protein [Deltaproteobacteria bacterium]MCK5709231.1 hypothetical protein [Deltaproteobacteria bacterium]